MFGQTPRVFRNTELIYNNDLAKEIEALGYDALLAEGADHVMGWRSPNYVYRPEGCSKIKLLLKNYALSDDIAFRFSNTIGKISLQQKNLPLCLALNAAPEPSIIYGL